MLPRVTAGGGCAELGGTLRAAAGGERSGSGASLRSGPGENRAQVTPGPPGEAGTVCVSANGQNTRDLKAGSEPQPLPSRVSAPRCLAALLSTVRMRCWRVFTSLLKPFCQLQVPISVWRVLNGVQGPGVLSSEQTHSLVHSIVLRLFSCFLQTSEQFVCVDPFIHHQNNPLHRTGGRCLISHSKPARWFGVGSEKHHVHSNLGFTELEDRERQRAGIAPGETWAGCAGSASSEASQLPQHSQVRAFSSRPLAEARREQRQQPSSAQAGARGPPTAPARGSALALLLCGPFADPLAFISQSRC